MLQGTKILKRALGDDKFRSLLKLCGGSGFRRHERRRVGVVGHVEQRLRTGISSGMGEVRRRRDLQTPRARRRDFANDEQISR
jgi:hypothetical protein